MGHKAGYAVSGEEARRYLTPLDISLHGRITNSSGILPTEFKVVIRPVEVADKIGSIIIPDDTKERKEHAQQEGILIAVSPAAFSFFEKEERPHAPKPGDRVLYAKYAGFTRKGSDGVEYRIVADKDVCAVLT